MRGTVNEIERMGEVDQDPRAHAATEPDEEIVLKELYGPPDGDGVYRGKDIEGDR